MPSESHIAVARTEVRLGTLARHVARPFGKGQTFAVASGLGMPRTWSVATGAALRGFGEGLAAAAAAPEGLETLRGAVLQARARLAARCDELVERILPDSALVALSLVNGELHVLSAGPGRVYIQRSGRPKRLTSRDDTPGGLLRSRPSQCSIPVRPGDLILAGSITAFSMSSIAKVVSALSTDPKAQPALLAELLTEPAGKAGVGAAAVVLRC